MNLLSFKKGRLYHGHLIDRAHMVIAWLEVKAKSCHLSNSVKDRSRAHGTTWLDDVIRS